MGGNNIISQYVNMCIQVRCLIRYLDVVMCLSHIHIDTKSLLRPSLQGKLQKTHRTNTRIASNIKRSHFELLSHRMCSRSCLSALARLFSRQYLIKADSTVKAVPEEDCLGPVETLYD